MASRKRAGDPTKPLPLPKTAKHKKMARKKESNHAEKEGKAAAKKLVEAEKEKKKVLQAQQFKDEREKRLPDLKNHVAKGKEHVCNLVNAKMKEVLVYFFDPPSKGTSS
eukprot:CAMPEP_0194034856 /NCGR_PEP_ID=MMETSP0009_2-20130614/7307_1 /TAXON_ID=210454 /ORGANISM="Grammatophora oceanica, Strain CCMP 410" /LENGTH=108 /DNA_ID=CAMNT_0038675959 /DNA_START=23 /DNA_END=347 /DNA_ORIENTATION=-